MKPVFTLLFAAFIFQTTRAQFYAVPPAYDATIGTGTFLGPFANAQRTYQLLINENQLTGLIGSTVQGIAFRLRHIATAAWPAATTTYSNYDIYMGQGVAPASRSLTDFSANIVGTKTPVRSGSLSITAGAYPFGSTPNAFGAVITFSTPYLYTGGHLIVEIRHTGSDGTSSSVDALTSTTTGFGTDFSACWTGNYLGTAGSNGNFCIFRFSTLAPVPLSLSNFVASLQANDAKLYWKTSQEINTRNFEIERSFDGRNFSTIASLDAAGSISNTHNYGYTDANIVASGQSVVYYRLKMFDIDNRFTYSPVAIINIKSKAGIVSLYPNPITSGSIIRIAAANSEQVSYRILNSWGQTFQTGLLPLQKGNNEFPLPGSNLAAGNYYLLLEGKYTRNKIPFIKK